MAGLSVDIAANTRAAQANVKDLGKALDEVSDSLDDLARESVDNGSKLERGIDDSADAFKDVSREADTAADKVERSFRDMVTDAKKADTAIARVGDTGGGFSKAGEASGEFKQEALANFSEVTSSFDGSMSSIQDLAQGTLGGLAASGLPGIGIAAGLAAVAVGTIGASFEANAEAEEAAKERAGEWAQAYIDAGDTVLTAAITAGKALDIITDSEKLKTAEQNATDWGVSTSTAVAAMAGESWALSAAQEALADKTLIANRKFEEQAQSTTSAAGEVQKMTEEVDRGADSMKTLTDDMSAGAAQADTYSQYLRTMAENTEGATQKVDKFGDKVYSLPDGTKVYVDAETGQATTDVDKIKSKIYSIPDEKKSKVKMTVDDSAVRNYRPPIVYIPGQVIIGKNRAQV